MDKRHQTKGDRAGAGRDKAKPARNRLEKRHPNWSPLDDLYGEKPPVDRGMDLDHPRYGKRPPKA